MSDPTPAPTTPSEAIPEHLREFAQVFQIIAQATGRFLDNTRNCQQRASDALIIHHGMLLIAAQNRELSLDHIKGFRDRLQLVIAALDQAEAALKEMH